MDDSDPESKSAKSNARELTAELLERAQRGEDGAVDELLEHCIPAVRRWARGKLPQAARGTLDTQDLVQESVASFVRRIPHFVARHPGAVQAYLRRSVQNLIRDKLRAVARRPAAVTLEDVHADSQTSPLERAIGSEQMRRVEVALQQLSAKDQALIIARLYLHQSYEEIAAAVGQPSAAAARMALVRAMSRLASEIRRGR